MISINIVADELKITGTFNFGYAGIYLDDKIQIIDTIDEIREWNIVCDVLDSENCTDKEIVQFLTDYFNDFEKKIEANLKSVNDNFLLKVFLDMEACGNEFWGIDDLTIKEHMPSGDDIDVYEPYWDVMKKLAEDYGKTPNDGSVAKEDIEGILRKNYPMFNFDEFLSNIIPESLSLSDGSVSFQCSDNFDNAILCSAYDNLDEQLCFTDWHNF